LAGLQPGITAQVLHSAADGLSQITEILSQGHPPTELHLVAHGRAGALLLGGQWIDTAKLLANAQQLAQWQVGRIALWSCEVGQDQGFIALLSELTGAKVFASKEVIGGNAVASWQLSGGSSQTAVTAPFTPSTLAHWSGRLQLVDKL
ncbi:DUF4347 domain-containing protein, partial [Synechocystis salina LEGE 06155]|nr:DUF4347 domain-containing protein [Synechocystis salina LEGE 06155]